MCEWDFFWVPDYSGFVSGKRFRGKLCVRGILDLSPVSSGVMCVFLKNGEGLVDRFSGGTSV